MTTLAVDHNQHQALIYTAANAIAGRPNMRGHIDRDDIVGHLWEWSLRNAKRINRWQDEKDSRELVKLTTAVLYDEAHIYARKEKAARLGYPTSDDFFYTKPMIEDLLKIVLDDDRETWLNVPAKAFDSLGSVRSVKALNEGNNWLTTLSDVSRAVGLLEQSDTDLLKDVYLHEKPRSRLAEAAEISRKGLDNRVDRALRRLWRHLGGPEWLVASERQPRREREDGPGTRRAISNAHARAISESHWEAS